MWAHACVHMHARGVMVWFHWIGSPVYDQGGGPALREYPGCVRVAAKEAAWLRIPLGSKPAMARAGRVARAEQQKAAVSRQAVPPGGWGHWTGGITGGQAGSFGERAHRAGGRAGGACRTAAAVAGHSCGRAARYADTRSARPCGIETQFSELLGLLSYNICTSSSGGRMKGLPPWAGPASRGQKTQRPGSKALRAG